MPNLKRRTFLATGATAISNLDAYFAGDGSSAVDEMLRSGIAHRKIPAAVGIFADSNKTLYAGAVGKRDSSGPSVRADSLFRIASMTKAVTTVAALQLVEEGKLTIPSPSRGVFRNLPISMSWRVSTPTAALLCGPLRLTLRCGIY